MAEFTRERHACLQCPAFYKCEKGNISATAGGWLETDFGILDFDDHGCTWWLTERVALENVRR